MSGRGEARRECLSSGAVLALAVAYVLYGLRYSLDSFENPGPGVFPRVIGLLLVALAAAQLVASALRARRAAAVAGGAGAPAPPAGEGREGDLRGPLLMGAVLVAYVLLVGRLGFATCSFALTLAACKIMGARGWARPLALGAGLVVACHLVFNVWLHVPLPTGLLG